MAAIDLKDARIYIRDGSTPTPNYIEVKIGTGNLTYSEKRNMEYLLDRGRLDLVRQGDEVPLDVSFDATWEYIRGGLGSGDFPSIHDALKKQGNASDWESSSSDPCEPYAVDIVVHYIPNCATGDHEVIIFPDFRWESLDQDLRAATISAVGKCNSTEAIATRHAPGSSNDFLEY